MFESMTFPFFLGITVLLFFLLPAKYRAAVLLFSSYCFCGFMSFYALAVLKIGRASCRERVLRLV